jgi:GGDEF domain-containing protein
VLTLACMLDVRRVADRILEATARPFVLDDLTISVNVSIGIAHTDDTLTVKDLMRKADSAMYVAKRQGKANGYSRRPSNQLRPEASRRGQGGRNPGG